MRLTSGVPGQPRIWHMADMGLEKRQQLHGRGHCDPLHPVTAGNYVSITFRFEIGETMIPSDGRLAVAWRWPIDWADLQTNDPQGDGFMAISTGTLTGQGVEAAVVEAQYYQRGSFDPWHHHIELVVRQGKLTKGDRVQLVCGDRSGGGRGWRAPTLRVKSASFLMLINPDNGQDWIRLPDAPDLSIQSGPPVRLVTIAPSEGVMGESLDILVRAEDRWGNPTHIPEGLPQLYLAELSSSGPNGIAIEDDVVVSQEPAAYRFSVQLNQAGIYRLTASVPGTDLVTEGNPIRVHSTPPAQRLFWGDLHSGQTEIGCGAGTLGAHYAFAREAAGLQFLTHQANDHYMTRADWQQTREETEAFHEPGRFVPFLGCEWSALTEDGGDRNVIYRYDEPRLRRSGRFFTEVEPDPEPDLTTAPAFLEAMKDEPVLINMHVGGRPTNLDYHAPEIERLAEIHSTHGTSEWFIKDALSRGYKVGITAGTDGVMGRPGGCHPGWRLNRNVRNGLTAVYAEALTQEALWAAFQARRCYGTTGERIILWVEVDGQPMGADYQADDPPVIKIAVEGTAPIEYVELLRGTDCLCRWHIALPDDNDQRQFRILWGGTERRGTARDQRVTWDGALRLTEGKIIEARSIGFQSADDEFQLRGSKIISWQSATAGNSAGLILRIEGDEATVGHFTSEPVTFDFKLDQVSLAPMLIEAGGLDRRVTVGPLPRQNGPRRAELSYRDEQPEPGEWPYWVRVVQIDQAKAWSSPVYVTYKGKNSRL